MYWLDGASRTFTVGGNFCGHLESGWMRNSLECIEEVLGLLFDLVFILLLYWSYSCKKGYVESSQCKYSILRYLCKSKA
jgi:hypothetical protein